MSTVQGGQGNIVTNGLVLNLDAANPRSYAPPFNGTTWQNLVAVSSSISGSLVNGPIFGSENGGYIRCDGTNDYIEVLDNPSLNFGSGSFTVEYWFRKLTTTTGFDNIWGPNKWNTGASPGTNEWIIAIGDGNIGTGNQYSFGVEVGSISYGTGNSPTQLSLNTWYQLICQRDGASFKTYLNGTLTMNVTSPGFTTSSIINNIGRNLRINNSGLNNLYTNADNANIKIYNRALNASEVLQNFNATRARFGV
jgi:hypothetical protein